MATVYEIITDRIISLVKEKGHLPWQKPWKSNEMLPANLERPNRPYRGINFWILLMQGRKSPYWVTVNQVKKMGGRVIYEEWKKSTTVVFWKFIDDKNSETKRKIPLLRYYNVYSIEQCTGIPESKIPVVNETPLDFNPIAECEKIIQEMPIDFGIVDHGFNHACYKPFFDKIEMPDKQDFKGEPEYYSTLFHELAHATGHENRLNRKGAFGAGFGRERYSKEELVAEISTCFICHTAGIENTTIDNSAAYLGSWLKQLKNDPQMLIFAASQAQKVSDYILNMKPDVAEPTE